jgi:hypothetical protein
LQRHLDPTPTGGRERGLQDGKGWALLRRCIFCGGGFRFADPCSSVWCCRLLPESESQVSALPTHPDVVVVLRAEFTRRGGVPRDAGQPTASAGRDRSYSHRTLAMSKLVKMRQRRSTSFRIADMGMNP